MTNWMPNGSGAAWQCVRRLRLAEWLQNEHVGARLGLRDAELAAHFGERLIEQRGMVPRHVAVTLEPPLDRLRQ